MLVLKLGHTSHRYGKLSNNILLTSSQPCKQRSLSCCNLQEIIQTCQCQHTHNTFIYMHTHTHTDWHKRDRENRGPGLSKRCTRLCVIYRSSITTFLSARHTWSHKMTLAVLWEHTHTHTQTHISFHPMVALTRHITSPLCHLPVTDVFM